MHYYLTIKRPMIWLIIWQKTINGCERCCNKLQTEPISQSMSTMNALQYYAQVIVEMVTIANAALKESE